MTLPVITTMLRLPYPTVIEMVLDGKPHKIEGQLVSVSDDGKRRQYIIRDEVMGADIVFTMPPGDRKIETAYDEHGVKWARTLGGGDGDHTR